MTIHFLPLYRGIACCLAYYVIRNLVNYAARLTSCIDYAITTGSRSQGDEDMRTTEAFRRTTVKHGLESFQNRSNLPEQSSIGVAIVFVFCRRLGLCRSAS